MFKLQRMLPLCFMVNKSPWWGLGTMVGGYSQNEELNLSHLRPLTIMAVPSVNKIM